MKKEILKIAGVKSEKEFYKKYPTEAAFMKAHKKEFKKAAMGASMVEKQLKQLTDYANPPQAQDGSSMNQAPQIGDYIGGEQSSYKPTNYAELYDQADYANTGMNREMRMKEAELASQQKIAANSDKKGILGDLMGGLKGITGELDALAKDGKHIRKAQTGATSTPSKFSQQMQAFNTKVGQGYDKLNKNLEGFGGVSGVLDIGTNLLGGFQQIGEEKKQQRAAHQAFDISKLTKQVAGLAPDIKQRKYVRPEDMGFGTQEMGQAYGTSAGNQFIAEDGAMVGGNPTEIQNMYNPGDIYSDMGYEPLSDSEIVKQYRRGGHIQRAQFGLSQMAGQAGGALGSLIGGGKGKPTGGGKIGSTIGSTVGNLIVPGLGGIVGGAIGGIAGGVLGGKSAKKTANWEAGAQQNTQGAAFMSGAKNLQGQNAAFMEDGGWVSHNWQPQVITQFGEYDLKDLLRPDETMNTLRAGGHLKSYTAPSAEAMSTERPEMAMGGNLKTTWGGYAEPVSQNPYLPGSGETVMFRGKSHDESDGNGHTGIGVKYGEGEHDDYTNYAEYGTEQADADVEVERGEPAVELPDAETGDSNLVVYGNMQIPSYGVSELGDPKAKGKKFKTYAKDLSKMEAKQNKTIEKGLKLVDSVDGDNPFDLLKLNSAKAMLLGANEELKGLAIQKQRLAGIQNAILDTAEEMGVESDGLSKGQIKPIKDPSIGKFGAKLETAQKGKNVPKKPLLPKYQLQSLAKQLKVPVKQVEKELFNKIKPIYTPTTAQLDAEGARFRSANPEPISTLTQAERDALANQTTLGAIGPVSYDRFPKSKTALPTAAELAAMDLARKNKSEDKFSIEDALRQLQPYLTPSNQEPFDYQQITPELYALASNQLEGVQAQTFQPLLEQPYTVSLQDQLNANQADFNALQRQMGYNPEALSQLAAQKYAANSSILGQQLRANQELAMGAYNRNRGVLNDAALKNLAILDTQYQRQSAASSATKAQAQAALSSIADKIAKNKLENRTLGVYENMYNYRFGPKGRAYNVNAPMDWNIDLSTMSPDEIDAIQKAKDIMEKKKGKTTAKNGSIVKAIKNL